MKQPKVQIPDPLPPVFVLSGPRYRYFSEPPSVVTLRVGDLLSEVPDAVRVLGCDESSMLELSAEEIFQGSVPKISVRRLVEIAPDCFRSGGQPDLQIPLPAGRLALSYRPVIGKELLEDVPPPAPPLPLPEAITEIIEEEPPAVELEDFAPPKPPEPPMMPDLPPIPAAEVVEETKAEQPEANLEAQPDVLPPSEFSPLINSIAEISSPVEKPMEPLEISEPLSFAEPIKPSEPASLPPAPVAEKEQNFPTPPPAPVAEKEPIIPPPPAPATPPALRGSLFSMLPIFRRKAAEAAPAEVETPKRPRIELPPPRVQSAVLQPLHPEVETPEPKPAPISSAITPELPVPLVMPPPMPVNQKIDEPIVAAVEAPAEFTAPIVPPVQDEAPPISEIIPPEPIAPEAEAELQEEPNEPAEPEILPPVLTSALLVETEHLPKETPRESEGEIPDHDALQALFLTEEFLTVDRVVELCGGLPGINSCVLSHGAAVIASHNVPDSIDLVSLSAHALDMLKAMRESSAKMGIGAVPAVTIHSGKGPITFFHQDDLCLLVLHKDKGFVPGVREKLQNVVSELTKARLTKTLDSATPRNLEG